MDEFRFVRSLDSIRWENQYSKWVSEQSISSWICPVCKNLDPDIEKALNDLPGHNKSIMDVGTGLGDQAIALAKRGFNVTATDVSPSALEQASARAKREGVSVNFLLDNILITNVSGTFDIINDRGCFAVLRNEFKMEYRDAVMKLLNRNGWLILKVDYGFSKLTEEVFCSKFNVVSKEISQYYGESEKKWKAMFYLMKKR